MHIIFSSVNITVLGSPQVFDEKILVHFVLHQAFHFGVRQIIQKLVLHKILDTYPPINKIIGGYVSSILCKTNF